MFLFDFTPHGVESRVGDIGEAVVESEDEEHGRVSAQRHRGIAALDALKRHTAHRRPPGEYRGRYPPAPARVANIRPELAQRPDNRTR